MCEALREFFGIDMEQQLKEANENGIHEGMTRGLQQGSNVVFDIQQKLKDGESKESLIGQGYEKSIVDRAYALLFS